MKDLGDLIIENSIYKTDPELTSSVLRTLGKNFGRILLHEWFLFWFPEYFAKYAETINTLFIVDEYIPITWRFYIALMAASTMRSDYLIRVTEDAFLFYGGDENWLLHGLNYVPKKIQKLAKINNIMAHQPWKIHGNDLNVNKFVIKI